MNIGKRIEMILEKEGRKKTWLAEKLNIPTSTMKDKLTRDTFRAEELLLLGIYLDIDLNKWKDEIKEQILESEKEIQLEYISNLIKEGFTSGDYPNWCLICEQLASLTKNDLNYIADLIVRGHISGYDPVNWEIKYEQPKL